MDNLTTSKSPTQGNTDPLAEPVPDWDEARELWGIAWEIHWIGFGLAFSVLAIASLIALVQANKKRRFDIAAAIECASVAILLIICQLFFIVWGLILSATFIYSGLKVIYRAKKVEKQLEKQRGANTSKVAKVTLGTSCLGLALSALQLYSLVSVYRFYDDFAKPAPWMWWGFQTCARLIEIAMACTIAYSVMKPSERNNASTARRRPTVEQKILEEKTAMGDII
ncbi:hypothetical protein ACROYT_G013497 [Oculina patagonica]